ncbi:MAG TPA: UvrB/UvrC motif-containing protein [Archangium sp.]|nr:UvrB/UvrC motif-containing protein [Archangium sp.]
MRGPSGELLYVGKSVKVRTRLLSYFRAQRGEKAAEIIGHAHGVEWDYLPSEFAALLEEFRLIKRWRPLYNVEHKRDSSLCFIKLTREAVPRLVVVGHVINDGAEYFGPLRGRQSATEAVRAVGEMLELRDCPSDTPMRLADQIELFRLREDPLCIRGQVGRCLSPCVGGCTRTEYLAHIAQARDFLNGATEQPLTLLRERMSLASRRLQFEYAAELRDRTATVERVQAELVRIGRFVERLSFVYTVPGHDGDDRVYIIRRGSVRAELAIPRTAHERLSLEEKATEIFEKPEPRTVGLRAHEAQEVLLVARWFRLNPSELERTVPVQALARVQGQGEGTATPG